MLGLVKALIEKLESALSAPLPGVEGQLLMSPRPRKGWTPGHLSPNARRGAGLLLLYPVDEAPYLVLTLRAGHLGNHAGQVSLPGGAVERGETIDEAALREANEEVNADVDDLRVLGHLSPIDIPVSRYVLFPVIAVASRRPDLRPDPGEVERVLEVPLDRLADPAAQSEQGREFKGTAYRVPYFDVCGERVWGATAMVLAEFLTVIGRPPEPRA